MGDSIWKINGSTTDDIGAVNCSRTLRNQSADTFRFEVHRPVDSAELYAYGAAITVLRDGAAYFSGIITRTPKSGGIESENHVYEASGVWWYLENIVFEQPWYQADDPSAASPTLLEVKQSRVILGQDSAGAKVTAGAQLTEILQFAIAAGAPFAIGTIGVTVTIPWDEVRDITCAEAIRRVLRWIPDAVVHVDYSAATPVVNIQRRAALTAAEYAIDAATTDSLEINPRDDLSRPAVVFRYVRTHRANSSAWETLETDFYPDPLPANWRIGSLVTTQELAGSSYQDSVIYQPVKVRSLPSGLQFSGNSTDAALISFWKRKFTGLQSSRVSGITLRNGERDEAVVGLNNELEEGAVTDWMEDEGIVVDPQRCSVEITYIYTDEDGKAVRKYETLETTIHATSAQTRDYSLLESSSYTPPEATPTGLAQAIYEALNTAHFEGSLVIATDECAGTPTVGNVLNLTAGHADWMAMNAMIQEVTDELDSGVTRITFGPPEHLGMQDLVELLRIMRNKAPVISWERRITGKSGSGERQQGLALHHPREGGTSTPLVIEPRTITATPTVAGDVPTVAELQAAVESAYVSLTPRVNDKINVEHNGRVKIVYALVTVAPVAGTVLHFGFNKGTDTYYVEGRQQGLW